MIGTKGGGVYWYLPGRKRPFAETTQATSDLINLLSSDGLSVRQIKAQIAYDIEAKAVMAYLIWSGYGDDYLGDFRDWAKPVQGAS